MTVPTSPATPLSPSFESFEDRNMRLNQPASQLTLTVDTVETLPPLSPPPNLGDAPSPSKRSNLMANFFGNRRSSSSGARRGSVRSPTTESAGGLGVEMTKTPSKMSVLSQRLGFSARPSQEPTPAKKRTVHEVIKSASSLSKTNTDHHNVRVHNSSKYLPTVWNTILQYDGSVLHRAILPVIIMTTWSAIWTCVFMLTNFRVLYTQVSITTVVSVVLGFLLVFRNSSAYERYWEGRKVWSTITTHVRNLSRTIWFAVQLNGDSDLEAEKRGAINLALAFPYAVMHDLRGETGLNHEDMIHLVAHTPLLDPSKENATQRFIPQEILLLLTSYMLRCVKKETLTVPGQTQFNNAVNALSDSLAQLDRIKNTPIPLAYSIHLKHMVLLFLFALPFQAVSSLYWATIPFVMVATFTLSGIECIAAEIENPFGYDKNDLAISRFCDDLRKEIHLMIRKDAKMDCKLWADASADQGGKEGVAKKIENAVAGISAAEDSGDAGAGAGGGGADD
ncbi:hypothetical protein HDV05_003962 [Chytridiales sp. JEL 0842]|nr:hypothetical protein HDV05_003962 [Chytridiales sp. JEL 0842]